MAHSRAGWPALIGWLTAFIGPPVVAGAVWQRFAGHHLALAIVVAVAYWVVVAVAGFIGGAAGDLAGRWRQRLVDHLDLAVQRRVSRFEKRYRKLVLASLRFIDLKGLATVGPFTPELDAVFVDVSLVPRPPHEIMPGVLGDVAPRSGRRALAELIGRPRPVVLAVVGGPGSGKTTLLRHTARRACLRERGRRGPVRDLPVLLYLRDHAAAITADPATASLAALLRATLGDLAGTEPPGWLEGKLRSGACVVLLDGLDEVARQEDRAKVAAWAERQIRSYPGNDFVITSRPHGYRTAPVEGAEVVQVCGFTSGQVEQFVRGWYAAVERYSTGAEGGDIDARAKAGADDLLRRLDRTPALHELTVNPLLLTMIANVHRYRGALPGSRAELYAEICQVILWRRQEAKNLASEMSGEKKETVLRALAFAMMRRQVSDLGRQDILNEMRPVLRRMSKKVTAEDMLADVGFNGLLIERETELYSFAHHTFQEYLAAAHIRDKGLVSVLAESVSDPWWREVTLLYGARADADPIVKACLDAGTVAALALAFDCADQDSEIDTDLRDRLDALLASGLDPQTRSERRRLITGVLLARHLRQQVSAADGTRVCARPVSTDVYQLFLADTLTPPPDAPADDVGTGTAVGMRGSDAAAFARWASLVADGEATYRLPGSTTLNDPAVQNAISAGLPERQYASEWVTQGSRHPLAPPALWLPPDAPHPHDVDAATLTAGLRNDIARTTPTQLRLLALHALVGARTLVNHLDGTRVHVPTHGSSRDRARARDLAVARARARTRARRLARDLDIDLGVARDFDLDLGLGLGLDFVRDRARALARDLDLDLDLDIALDRARALALDLDLALDRARPFDLDPDFDLDLDLYRARPLDLDRPLDLGRRLRADPDPDSDPDPDRGLGLALALDLMRGLGANDDQMLAVGSAAIMGRSLAQALATVIDKGGTGSNWGIVFAGALADQAGIGDRTRRPDPGALADKLAHAVNALRHALPRHDDTTMPSWAATVAERLAQAAGPVFDRQERPTPEAATGIRLAALCLAGEADGLDLSELGETFREIAAGITLLELRYTGQRPATEIIVLAVD